jgi:hypothetical protein
LATLLRIRNWTKFQHYKNRAPRWIKLHTQILNSADWVAASDSGKLRIICCLLAAALNDGCVPTDGKLLSKMCRLRQKSDLQPLIKSGFLIENASIKDASSNKRRERADSEAKKLNGHSVKLDEKLEASFLHFYSAYPRKVSPRTAMKAYAEVRNSGVAHERIMAGLERAKKNDKRFRESQYTPYPASWLRAGGFDDEGQQQSWEKEILS